jgi:choline dehydrogenase-like flavoprotein
VHGFREQILREGRRRQFGGTANLWNHEVRGGSGRHIRYVPLDGIDFERRDWVPESGWPFSRREIQPFYERAQQVCGIGKFDDQPGAREPWAKTSQRWQTEKIESIICLFGSSSSYLSARAITSAQAGTPDGRKFRVRAQAIVLAADGLENGRILLLQNSLQPDGLGNQYDMVRRCFMDHPAIRLGVLNPSSRAVFEQPAFMIITITEGKP